MVRKHVQKVTPNSRTGRLVVGIALIIGGILGFLPVLGFWMIPLGFLVLSVDFPSVRRFRRRYEVKIGRAWQNWKAKRRKGHKGD
ncbi:PGPGW domain-containing protein [Kordiimonas marina]|uniref:PGPGW domain-containing protein n=1 Tax=Kordiimonas marina TaxID=2872312 RepID=UPI001FF3D5B6|nr:PGPGW domain-containing protein [Kordiimonas marina]MCJ9430286.1 hypothetical protein [Kordiimonas marina]